MRALLAEPFVCRGDDAHRRIVSAAGADLLGVVTNTSGVDDGIVLVALVPAVHPGQHQFDGVVAALEELRAAHGREIELGGVAGAVDSERAAANRSESVDFIIISL